MDYLISIIKGVNLDYSISIIEATAVVITLLYTMGYNKRQNESRKESARNLLRNELKSIKKYIDEIEKKDIVSNEEIVKIRYIENFHDIILQADLTDEIATDIYNIYDDIYDYNYYIEKDKRKAKSHLWKLKCIFKGYKYSKIDSNLGKKGKW